MKAHFQFRGVGAAVICLAVAVILSHRTELGVQVERVTLAGGTPALRFVPAGSGSHPIALMAHGVTASKETLFRFGEALACAGFVCYAVDLPGHGESSRRFSPRDNAGILSQIARELGSVDVFVGHSMGAGAGAEAVREGGLHLRLFIAAGASPYLGEHGPPLLLLSGEFEELQLPAQLKERTDARLVLSRWSDHALEPYDPILVNAAVESACAAIGKTPPSPPTRWLWRLAGLLVAVPGAFLLALCFPELPAKWKWARGPLVAGTFIVVVILTTGTWLGAAPVLRRVPMQIFFIGIAWLLFRGAARIRLPHWSFAALGGGAAMGCAVAAICVPSVTFWNPFFRFCALFAACGALVLFAGTGVGWVATRGGSRRDGDFAMAIFIGYAFGQWMPVWL